MHLEVEIILELITEQLVSTEHLASTCIWPHPWDHYPFQVDGKREWVRYQDLEVEQKQLILNTLNEIPPPQHVYDHATGSTPGA